MIISHDLQVDIAAVNQIAVLPTILEVICKTTGMGFAAVARVTEDRWIACSVRDEILFGLEPGGELKIETTICNEIRQSREAVVIDQVSDDAAYRGHPTPAMYGFQSYISMPIILSDGSFFGTLCAIDPKPAQLSKPEVAGMFRLFADLVAFYLDAQDRAAVSAAALWDERQAAELREQFIAVLGHDLRNPLAAIDAGARLLSREALSGKGATIAGHIQNSVKRMAGLIDDMLDFARGRLGGGFQLTRDPEAALAPLLEDVIGELRAAWPDNVIEAHIALTHPVNCDPNRIAQLLSNLLGNALKHGAQQGPIQVRAWTDEKQLELTVSNKGAPIEPAVIERMFSPFFRLAQQSTQGLGLGLYIASEIARAHGGKLEVASSAEETRFTLRIPRV
jgi:signal transduction histidine kinase